MVILLVMICLVGGFSGGYFFKIRRFSRPLDTSINTVNIADGDTLFINLHGSVTQHNIISFREYIKKIFPSNKIIVTAGLEGLNISIFKR